ncbi:hypothetical protein PTI98_007565 [Pleurotus ostreatus]|nr:hypothetical protein PTI98_007565 [Pleurotus ostreatus]
MSSSANALSSPVDTLVGWTKEVEEALAQQPKINIALVSTFIPINQRPTTPTYEIEGAIPSLPGTQELFSWTVYHLLTSKKLLEGDVVLERKTLAFCTEIQIFHSRSAITIIDMEDILDPFEGELLAIPTNSLLSLDSLVFEPRHYGFGAVLGFYSQTANGHFVKVIIWFNRRLYEDRIQVERKVFVSFWVHKDHVAF